MPRLDEGHPAVIKYFGLRYNGDDPGATGPVDVCRFCAEQWEHYQSAEDLCTDVSHPPYEEQYPPDVYFCADCGEPLTAEDN